MTRLVLYATLGYLLDVLGHSWDSWGFWCVLALYMCSEHLARRDGYEQGMVFIATLSDAHLARIREEVDKITKDNN